MTNPIGCNVKWEGRDAHWMPAEACDSSSGQQERRSPDRRWIEEFGERPPPWAGIQVMDGCGAVASGVARALP